MRKIIAGLLIALTLSAPAYAARTFDGAGDEVRGGLGNCSLGYGTIVAVVKRNQTAWGSIFSVATALAALTHFDMEIVSHTPSGGVAPDGISLGTSTADVRSPTITILNADGWCLIAAGKATGTTTPRFHKYKYSTNAWTHEDAGGTLADGLTASDAVTQIGLFQNSDDYGGDIAVVGYFTQALTDAQVENLAFNLQNWYALNPRGLWVLDQQATSQKVIDLTGGHADETALTGTTASTNSVPVFNQGSG